MVHNKVKKMSCEPKAGSVSVVPKIELVVVVGASGARHVADGSLEVARAGS